MFTTNKAKRVNIFEMDIPPLIRDYTPADQPAVLQLLRLNTPTYFAPEEEQDLVHYLEQEREHYFVLEVNNQLVGCGGFNFSGDPTTGKISWDLLHPDFQRQSLGSQLLTYRIAQLQQFTGLQKIIVRTSQLAYRFYEKQGFTLVQTVDDYWGKGFHLYAMEYTRLLPKKSSGTKFVVK
jgi:[ribosomal protein S18]-alanine N-acetyltransferase